MTPEQAMAAGWSRFSATVNGAAWSKRIDGRDHYLDTSFRPVDMTPETPSAPSLLDEAHARLDRARPAEIARFVMGPEIDGPGLERVLESMSIDDALAEYTAADIKRWLARKGVATKAAQKDQLVALAATATKPTRKAQRDEREERAEPGREAGEVGRRDGSEDRGRGDADRPGEGVERQRPTERESGRQGAGPRSGEA